MNPLTIYLANLTHFRIGHISTETMPLNIGFLASYLLKVFGEKIAVSLFKYPPKLEASIRNAAPDVLCLSNYAWNSNLNYHYASYFKSAYPDITTIMGGPHYPGRPDRQEGFLRIHDKLDFYIFGEGELALAELINTLLNDRLNNEHLSVKEKIISIKGVHYIHKNTFVNNDKCERITDINLIPSPYLTNLLDEMLSENITPIIQTNRGCPFSCVYCHSSSEYFNSIRKFSLDRVKNEINYIMTKTTTDMIFIADDNFGIFEQDIEIQNYLIQCHKEHGWPNIAILSSAKQNKRTLEIALMLKKLRPFTVSLQSLNPATLKEIKRTNFTLEEYSAPLSELSKENGNSLGELILCLPQETETSFLESTKQLLNIGVREFEIYSCMLLPNTPLAEDSYYDRFQLRRMYRVLPRNFGDYLGKKII